VQRTPSELSYGAISSNNSRGGECPLPKKPTLFCFKIMITLPFIDIILVEVDGNHCYENKIELLEESILKF